MTTQQYKLDIRFGDELLEAGFTSVPNLFLTRYRFLGISDATAMWIIHLLRFKWTEKAPYPTQGGLPMSAAEKTRRRYARELRNDGLLFTRRVYHDKNTAPHPDLIGKMRTLEYHLDALFHNVLLIDSHLAAKKPLSEFAIELPAAIVQKVATGWFQDVPKSIKIACERHVANHNTGSLLLPQKRPVDLLLSQKLLPEKLLPEKGIGKEDSYLEEDASFEEEEVAGEEPTPASASPSHPEIYNLLSSFGIDEPALSKLSNDSLEPETVRAWIMYLDTQDFPRKQGYLVKRLREGDQPPTDFMQIATLTQDQLDTLARLQRSRHWSGDWRTSYDTLDNAGIDEALAEMWYQKVEA